MTLTTQLTINNTPLEIQATGKVEGSVLDGKPDYEVKVFFKGVDIFEVIEDSDIADKIYAKLDEVFFNEWFKKVAA